MNIDKEKDISVIIVNYNTLDYLSGCLESVAQQSDISFETIVVDNNSRDQSCFMVKEKFPWVNLIENKENLGFAKANNQAIKICRGRYVFFLNPDTTVEPECFQKMLAFMDKNPQIGLAGTKLLFPDQSFHPSVGDRYPGGHRAEKVMKGLTGDIAWVLGASMISPMKMIKSLNGFDEKFFLYGEEQDLCLRIRRSGLSIGYIPDATVIHWGGKSERGNLPAEVWSKKIKAEYLFYSKHYPEKTIQAIRRADLMQACWRIFSINLVIPFTKNKDELKNKLSKYTQVVKILRSRT